MTVSGTMVLDLIGLGLVLWMLSLVRRDRLHAGYATVSIALTVAAIVVISIPPLLTRITYLVHTVFPVSTLTVLTLCFIAVALIYVLSQLTILSNRLTFAIQELAIQRATARSAGESGTDKSGAIGFGEP